MILCFFLPVFTPPDCLLHMLLSTRITTKKFLIQINLITSKTQKTKNTKIGMCAKSISLQ